MAYEKMTPETFRKNLKEGKYKTATGARRAIGKAAWSAHDKEVANSTVLRHFGEGSSTPAKKTAAKKAHKAAPVYRTPAPSAPPPPMHTHAAPAAVLRGPLTNNGSASMETTTRGNSASMVISSLANRALTPLEQHAYDCALGESIAATSPEGLAFVKATANGAVPTKIAVPRARRTHAAPVVETPAAEEEEPGVTDRSAPLPVAPPPSLHTGATHARIPPFPPHSFPMPTRPLTAVEKEQHERARTVATELRDIDDARPGAGDEDEEEEAPIG